MGITLTPEQLLSDALTMAIRLCAESDDSHGPEAREVMERWRRIVYARFAFYTNEEFIAANPGFGRHIAGRPLTRIETSKACQSAGQIVWDAFSAGVEFAEKHHGIRVVADSSPDVRRGDCLPGGAIA